jgi:hypothetical protein
MSTFSNLRRSKIYPNWCFWFENKPSGDPDKDTHEALPLDLSIYRTRYEGQDKESSLSVLNKLLLTQALKKLNFFGETFLSSSRIESSKVCCKAQT